MRIVKNEEPGSECHECGMDADLSVEFEAIEETVPICRTCLVVMRWHMEQLEDE